MCVGRLYSLCFLFWLIKSALLYLLCKRSNSSKGPKIMALTNVFFEGTDSKYFQVCRPCSLFATIQQYSCSSEAAITRKHMGVAEFQWNYFWGLKFEFYVMYMCHQKKVFFSWFFSKCKSCLFLPNIKPILSCRLYKNYSLLAIICPLLI